MPIRSFCPWFLRKVLIILAALAVLLPGAASAGIATSDGPGSGRVALVIGIGDYQHLNRLATPAQDAEAVAAALRTRGFRSVTVRKNLTRAALTEALQAFKAEARGASLALIYFSGSGFAIDGAGGVLPVDAAEAHDREALRSSLVPVTALLEAAAAAHDGIVLVDSCNNDPFDSAAGAGRTQADDSHGLLHELLIYSASPGEVAMDSLDGAPTSPFTAQILRTLPPKAPISLGSWLGRASRSLESVTQGRQHPWVQGSLQVLELSL